MLPNPNQRPLLLITTISLICNLFTSHVNGVPQECRFPESTSTQSFFFFDIRADTPPGSVIVDSVVEPADAQLRVFDIRSNNLKVCFLKSLGDFRSFRSSFRVFRTF